MVFKNNDLPGIFLGNGALRLMHKDGIKPGEKAVLITCNDYAYLLARQILAAGISIEAICDCREEKDVRDSNEFKTLKQTGTSIYFNCRIKAAIGGKHVRGLSFSYLADERIASQKVTCDFICVCNSRLPANDFIFQKNYRGSYVLESSFKIARKPNFNENMEVEEGLYVAGESSGVTGLTRAAYLQGKIAGISAAIKLNYKNPELLHERTLSINSLKHIMNILPD
jgi:sarcosine oxidase subunit alpha